MKKILVTIGGYLPGTKYGGPVTSITNFVNLLYSKYEIYIVTSNHDLNSSKEYQGIIDGWNKVGEAKVKYLCDRDLSNIRILKSIIDEIKPDVIYHNGLYDRRLAIPIAFLSRYKAIPPIIFVPRGDLGPVFPEKKKYIKKIYVFLIRYIINCKRVVFQATSKDEKKDIINRLGAKENSIYLIPNIPTFQDNINIVKLSKNSGELNIIYFARIHPTKNLLTALKALSYVNGKIKFNIYGGIENPKYWDKCLDVISKLPSNINVIYHGVVEHDKAYECFSNNHVLLFPTRNKENFGHTIVEGIMANIPVIISDQTPWNDIVTYGAGWVYPGDDIKGYSRSIQYLIDIDNIEYEKIVDNVVKYKNIKFSKDQAQKNYKEMLIKTMRM